MTVAGCNNCGNSRSPAEGLIYGALSLSWNTHLTRVSCPQHASCDSTRAFLGTATLFTQNNPQAMCGMLSELRKGSTLQMPAARHSFAVERNVILKRLQTLNVPSSLVMSRMIVWETFLLSEWFRALKRMSTFCGNTSDMCTCLFALTTLVSECEGDCEKRQRLDERLRLLVAQFSAPLWFGVCGQTLMVESWRAAKCQWMVLNTDLVIRSTKSPICVNASPCPIWSIFCAWVSIFFVLPVLVVLVVCG